MWSRCWPGRWWSRPAAAASRAAAARDGEPHGPYTYFVAATAGRGAAMRYVPADLVAAVRARLRRGEQVEAVLAEISAINAELLARRELD